MNAGANWVSTEGVYTLTRQLPLTRELARWHRGRLAGWHGVGTRVGTAVLNVAHTDPHARVTPIIYFGVTTCHHLVQ
jgi:hypothetical protein